MLSDWQSSMDTGDGLSLWRGIGQLDKICVQFVSGAVKTNAVPDIRQKKPTKGIEKEENNGLKLALVWTQYI